ncbi:unnamed protein product, partial [Rhizoctonia solani]
EYGDLDDEEWMDMYERTITLKDRNVLRFLASRLRTHFSRQTYDDLRHGACEELQLPSEFVAWRRLRILSGLETRAYDCCVHSCCCFLGKYKDLTSCPFCKEARFKSNGQPRRVFRYTPLIPQLRGRFQDPEISKKLGYRVLAEQQYQPGKILDVFDAEYYRLLRRTLLDPETGYHFFDNQQDLALGIATDGFTLFKRRRRGLSTAWPIIIINYNLHPRIRNRLENVICVGVIPGPKQCKDLNSFLVPLLDELLELESGVDCPTPPTLDREGSNFVFRAFVIIIFGDMPAVAKLLMLKGHNAIKPCRACMIQGVLCHLARNSVYYVPLAHPIDEDHVLTYDDLEPRTHQGFLDQLEEIEAAPTAAARQRLAQKYGLNGRCIFTRLRSINLATCAPYDAMHLLFENLVPNMIKHWTGKFKGLDQGSGNYQMELGAWEEAGRQTVAARCTTPSLFVSAMPDIALDGYLYTAEMHAYWIQYTAPIVLKDKLPKEYYDHMLLMRDIIALSIQLEISHEEIDQLQRMINEWVADYEIISSREKVYPAFNTVVLGIPMKKVLLDDTLRNQLTKYFGLVYSDKRYGVVELRSRIDPSTLMRYGRFRLAGDGDKIRTANIIDNDPLARDNSFVRYDLLPDRNTAFRNRPDRPFRQTHYGRVLDIYYVEFITQKPKEATENEPAVPRITEPYLLVRIRECNTGGLDATDPLNRVVKYSQLNTPDIIHIDTINAVVGRMKVDNRNWAIIDRSASGARTQFVDEAGNEFD